MFFFLGLVFQINWSNKVKCSLCLCNLVMLIWHLLCLSFWYSLPDLHNLSQCTISLKKTYLPNLLVSFDYLYVQWIGYVILDWILPESDLSWTLSKLVLCSCCLPTSTESPTVLKTVVILTWVAWHWSLYINPLKKTH